MKMIIFMLIVFVGVISGQQNITQINAGYDPNDMLVNNNDAFIVVNPFALRAHYVTTSALCSAHYLK